MRLLGIPAGPMVGRAWKFLKDLRLDRGPLDHDDAVAELYEWARAQGLDGPFPAHGDQVPDDAEQVDEDGPDDQTV
jgi:poly(A) polymerase